MAGLSKALRRKPDSVWGKTKSCKKSKAYKELNASFQTRHGHITLDLAIPSTDSGNISPFPGDKLRTRMYVATRHGRISVDMVRLFSSSLASARVLTSSVGSTK